MGWGEAEAIDESAYEEFDGSAGHLLELAGMTELCESVESQSRPRIDRNRFRVPEAATLISRPAGGCPPHPAHAEIANKRRRELAAISPGCKTLTDADLQLINSRAETRNLGLFR